MSRFDKKRLRFVVEEVNRALDAVAGTIEEDLSEKFFSGLNDDLDYRDWIEDALHNACVILNLSDDVCDKLIEVIEEKYLEAEIDIKIKMRVTYEDFLKALYEATK